MSAPKASRTFIAVMLALTAILGFDMMGVMVRLLSERGYSPSELSAYRNVLGILPSVLVLAWMGELRLSGGAMKVTRWKLALFRGLTVAVAQLCFYTALTLLELATVSALAQTNALFVVLLSVFLLKERVGPWRIFALILGFVGALWVMRPGSDSFSPAAVLPILAAFFYGFSILSVRMFDKGVSNALLYLYASAASAGGAILLALATTGFSPLGQPIEILMIFFMSMAGGTAVLLLMLAYRMAPPSLLAPFSYLSILSAFTLGWVIFGEAPIDTLFPGVLLIIGAGGVIIWRENFVSTR
ncbi:MAG: DMT family transporter [Paracoccaceae bacterium]